ncbi:MAG: hypothetical protein LBV34_25995, partial [Nocardiopsaceae bacterium]|nr:hypothetical protein [Nocardiopsaceae bacterium]
MPVSTGGGSRAWPGSSTTGCVAGSVSLRDARWSRPRRSSTHSPSRPPLRSRRPHAAREEQRLLDAEERDAAAKVRRMKIGAGLTTAESRIAAETLAAEAQAR